MQSTVETDTRLAAADGTSNWVRKGSAPPIATDGAEAGLPRPGWQCPWRRCSASIWVCAVTGSWPWLRGHLLSGGRTSAAVPVVPPHHGLLAVTLNTYSPSAVETAPSTSPAAPAVRIVEKVGEQRIFMTLPTAVRLSRLVPRPPWNGASGPPAPLRMNSAQIKYRRRPVTEEKPQTL